MHSNCTNRVAIIGGGFSGTMAVANLVEIARAPLTIEWFESSETVGAGVAYGTKDCAHLLNVRAARMGAYAGKPGHFLEWLQSSEGKAQCAAICPDYSADADSFAPRPLYGAYLRTIADSTLAKAKDKGIELHIRRTHVTGAALHDAETGQILLTVKRGGIAQEILVDCVVLATGNQPPRQFSFQSGMIRGKADYIANIWDTSDAELFPSRVHELSADTEVVLIGTGLTAVDAILTLKSRGYKGKITAISRSGLLPAAHAHIKSYPGGAWVAHPEKAPRTALGLLQGLRAEIREAAKQGHDWRAVIDALRPVTQTLWKQLGVAEKRRFMARLFTVWNVHRHRMAEPVHAQIEALKASGALTVIAAKIYYVGTDEDGLTVAYRRRGTNHIETMRSTLVLNCTGPEYDIAASDHPLLAAMRDSGLITIGPLRIGMEITPYGTARGLAPETIFPMGSLRIGELLECTAVPELREQAYDTAQNVIRQIRLMSEQDRKTQLLMGAWI